MRMCIYSVMCVYYVFICTYVHCVCIYSGYLCVHVHSVLACYISCAHIPPHILSHGSHIPPHITWLQVYISCAYWLLNRTGIPLVFKQEGANVEAAGQSEEHERACSSTPLLFAYQEGEYIEK